MSHMPPYRFDSSNLNADEGLNYSYNFYTETDESGRSVYESMETEIIEEQPDDTDRI